MQEERKKEGKKEGRKEGREGGMKGKRAERRDQSSLTFLVKWPVIAYFKNGYAW